MAEQGAGDAWRVVGTSHGRGEDERVWASPETIKAPAPRGRETDDDDINDEGDTRSLACRGREKERKGGGSPRRLKLIYIMSNATHPTQDPRVPVVDALGRLLAATSQREVDDARSAFQRRSHQHRTPSREKRPQNFPDALREYTQSREALLIVKPLPRAAPYYFNSHTFSPGSLCNIIQHFRHFEFELHHT